MLRTALPALVLFCLPSIACSASPDWTGVWSGTLDSSPIVACNNGNGTGSYYELSRRRLLPLQWLDGQWQELGSGARWQVDSVDHEAPVFQRTDPESGAMARLHLSARSFSAQGACGSEAYLAAPLLKAGPPLSKEARFEDRRFFRLMTRLLDEPELGVETVQLPADSEVIGRLNQQWRDALPADEQQWAPWRSCASSSLAHSGDSGIYRERSSISFWTRSWLALQTGLKTRCGDTPESERWGYRLWHLASGREVDPWSWFGLREAFPERVHQRGWARLTPALQRVVLREWPEEEDCRASDTWYALRPAVLGLVFERVGVSAACSDEMEIPWSRLQPLLNPAGKLAVQSLANSVQQ